ncbi:family 93 glycoside hydrolase [Cryphonectria parasitica EP155]|uniref:Family 93 glycoside hydrolase n=1 Tax=Cryphonectria parasitica (strain ATCC 38755 / EP155) TaxID=660469 RepID=A0A9P5CMW6_CRYP1|nr:family 93 glycoside hydrolase [Cryphonectria parasitica EP155]KAF3763310.1 family 93 glycoside hydrolase [Cryphonectria parasitica EP155]
MASLGLTTVLILLYWTGCVAAENDKRDVIVTFNDIFVPPSDYIVPKTLYGRTVQLADGTLLATWENYSPEPPNVYFPIFRSTDYGQTWAAFSNVTDQVNDWGLRYQPFLYLLPQAIGDLAAGTILCAGNSIPSDLSQTQIDLYASTDDGASWSYVSSIASGGVAEPVNGDTPVWEPFLMVYDDQLVAYYSDQSDTTYAQKLAHKTSTDGVTWGTEVNDVAQPTYSARPGMATVAEMGNGEYIMTYEYCGTEACDVYYRISDSPLTFDSATDNKLTANGVTPVSSPYVVWSSSGGTNGTIVVSADSNTQIFISTALGDPDSWVEYDTPQSGAYSRHLRVMDDPDYLLIMSAGYLDSDNWVTLSVMELPNL